MNLPEKLRNLGIQPAPKEKVKVMLSETKMNIMEDLYLPILDKEQINKGA